jgi:peptide-methionine (R)-S-oxide reductase
MATTSDIPTGTQSLSGYDIAPLSSAERGRLAMRLSEDERRVLLQDGTEHPFCGGLLDNKEAGVYACRLCGLPLFNSTSKFESGTGWPSFYEPFDPEHIAYIRDTSLGMARTEIRCKRCDGHLGHVFPDGPPPTGLRYCLNSVAMEFKPAVK